MTFLFITAGNSLLSRCPFCKVFVASRMNRMCSNYRRKESVRNGARPYIQSAR
jgi:hypothetical protein